MPTQITADFTKLATTYRDTTIEFPALKPATLAQWILESGYGQSALARQHFNFGGLKWRKEMEGLATPVDYDAHDGKDKYCKFASIERFIEGYWRFIDRSPYAGWRNHASTGEAFIRFVGPIYTPSQLYADHVVALLPAAGGLLGDGSEAANKPPGTAEPAAKPPIKQFIASPNISSRNGERIRRIVMHYTTARDVEGTLSWFLNPKSQVSAHYVIARNGDIYQMVRDADKAWHARNANADSIGIEHSAAQGDAMTPQQEETSVALLRWLLAEYKLAKTAITGHRYTPENVGHTDCPHSLFGEPTEAALRTWVETKV